MSRVRERYEEFGYDGLFNRATGKPSPKRVPMESVEQVLTLYQERCFDLNVHHFHERLREEHGITLSYTWIEKALQESGLVKKTRPMRGHSDAAKTLPHALKRSAWIMPVVASLPRIIKLVRFRARKLALMIILPNG